MHSRPIDLGLARVREVFDRLDVRLPGVKFIIGGTNGKGSTCAMLESILLAAGFRVGCYTSPHLLRFNERARIDGVAAYDLAGRSVASAGDVNGDGFADMIIGAPYADPDGSNSVSAYVVYGGPAGGGSTATPGNGIDPPAVAAAAHHEKGSAA